jgi:hypothetical protein
MSEIILPFRPDMRTLILQGRKTATSRFRRHGHPSDHFYVDGRRFVITEVRLKTLGWVASTFYKEEGFDSPDGFWQVWREIHPKRSDPEALVWVHIFKEVGK